MTCDVAGEEISAFIDGELPHDRARAARQHMAECAACMATADAYRKLRTELKSAAYEPAPAGLAERIRIDLAEVDLPPAMPILTHWLRHAAALLLVATISAAAGWIAARSSNEAPRVERDVLVAHVRSLVQGNAIQIASSDRHTVKPWFTGRIDFAPAVPDLAANGFVLKGARIDYVGERQIAAVVYTRRLHIINVLSWPTADGLQPAPSTSSLNGYNMIGWRAGGLQYWAVSDLNSAELREFQGLQ